MRKSKCKAFTMAEILLVMGIIGIIGALSLPKLKDNIDERTLVSSTKKLTVDLQDSYTEMISRWNEPDSWFDTDVESGTATSTFAEKWFKSLAVSKQCNTGAGCFSSNTTLDTDTSYYKAILKNGASVAFNIDASSNINLGSSCMITTAYPCAYGKLYVDVNGQDSGPNADGYDIFGYTFSNNGVEPNGYTDNYSVNVATSENSIGKINNTAWVVKAGNQDYNKCADIDWANHQLTCK